MCSRLFWPLHLHLSTRVVAVVWIMKLIQRFNISANILGKIESEGVLKSSTRHFCFNEKSCTKDRLHLVQTQVVYFESTCIFYYLCDLQNARKCRHSQLQGKRSEYSLAALHLKRNDGRWKESAEHVNFPIRIHYTLTAN